MKHYFYIILSAIIFASQLVWAAPQDLTTKGQSQSTLEQTLRVQLPFSQVTKLSSKSMLFETGNDNLLFDPGFERDLSTPGANGWTSDGNMVCVNSNSLAGTLDLYGVRWLEFSLAASTAGYCNSPSITVPPGLAGQPGELKFRTKGGSSTSRTITVTVYDGAGNILKVADTYLHGLNSTVYVPFVFPLAATSTTVYYRVAASSASLVMQMAIDDAYLGKASGEYNGSVYIPWTNYTPTVSSNGGTMQNYVVTGSEWMRDGENGSYNIYLTWTGAPGTFSIPRFSLPTGQTGVFQNFESIETCSVALVDAGATSYSGIIVPISGLLNVYYSFTNAAATAYTQAAPYAVASGDKIIVKCRNIKIQEWIGSGQNVMSLNTLPNLTNNNSYTPVITGGVSNPTQGTLVANKFYYTKVGQEVEVTGTIWQSTAGTAGSGEYIFSLPPICAAIDTNKIQAAASVTATPLGPANAFDGTNTYGGYSIALSATGIGMVVWNEVGGLALVGSARSAFSNATNRLGFKAKFPCTNLSASYADMPLVRNSMTCDDPGVCRTVYASSTGVCSSSPCALAKSSGVSSVTWTTGNYTVNFSPAFSSAPNCTYSVGGGTQIIGVRNSESTSSFLLQTFSGGVAANASFAVTCIGPR